MDLTKVKRPRTMKVVNRSSFVSMTANGRLTSRTDDDDNDDDDDDDDEIRLCRAGTEGRRCVSLLHLHFGHILLNEGLLTKLALGLTVKLSR